jgi:hypothetical protein
MKLILLYGAPAVGKLTVARELSRITGIGLAHNHLTINAAREAFGWGTPAFQRAIHRMRFVIIEEAAAEKLDLIATASYHHSAESEADARASFEKAEALGMEVCLVQLVCAKDVLEERVGGDERRAMRKLDSVEALRWFLEGKDYASGYPGTAMRIDNTDLAPEVVALRIAERFGLVTKA